jgi:hypothetical protein
MDLASTSAHRMPARTRSMVRFLSSSAIQMMTDVRRSRFGVVMVWASNRIVSRAVR